MKHTFKEQKVENFTKNTFFDDETEVKYCFIYKTRHDVIYLAFSLEIYPEKSNGLLHPAIVVIPSKNVYCIRYLMKVQNVCYS